MEEREEFAEEGPSTYYSLMHRRDGILLAEMKGDFATIRFHWGDQYILPADMVFYYFAAGMSTRSNISVRRAVERLKGTVYNNLISGSTKAKRISNTRWIGMPFSSFMAAYKDDWEITRPKHRGTCEKFRALVEKNTDYKCSHSTSFEGPNDSTIRIIYYEEDTNNVRRLKDRAGKNKREVEVITDLRAEAVTNLNGRNLESKSFRDQYNGGLHPFRRKQLTHQGIQVDKLEKLVKWQATEETSQELEEVPF